MPSAEWDIISGVGITALVVAAARAMETGRPGGLVADPFAAAFVGATSTPVPLPTGFDDPVAADPVWDVMSTYLGVRSRFFDEFFTGGAGTDQVVLLAAGLDARAYRLDWVPGTTLFELDVEKVLEFKDDILAAAGAKERCDRRAVAVDLREDWPAAIRRAGFDPARPTGWLAEGLLPFLPDESKDSLLARVDALSAPGSRIALEHIVDVAGTLAQPVFQNMLERFGFDFAELLPEGQDLDPTAWLSRRGWTVSSVGSSETGARFGRTVDQFRSVFVTATKDG